MGVGVWENCGGEGLKNKGFQATRLRTLGFFRTFCLESTLDARVKSDEEGRNGMKQLLSMDMKDTRRGWGGEFRN